MSWSILNFGKHRSKTLPQLLFTDPDWFYWAYEKNAFNNSIPKSEVQDIYYKSRSIKIPREGHNAEYTFDGIRGVFTNLELVPFDRAVHVGSSRTLRLNKIDMALIREAKGYDKLGYSLLIPILKAILFGKSNTKISRKKAEEFFEDSSNFTL